MADSLPAQLYRGKWQKCDISPRTLQTWRLKGFGPLCETGIKQYATNRFAKSHIEDHEPPPAIDCLKNRQHKNERRNERKAFLPMK